MSRLRRLVLVHDLPDRLDHRDGGVGLEDVAAHVDAGGALLDRVVGHRQGVEFRELLAAGDDDRHRAGGGDRVEVLSRT